MDTISLSQKTAIAVGMLLAAMVLVTSIAAAGPKGAQGFEVYDNTQDGLVVATDPDTGNVNVVANPGGQDRVLVTVHGQKLAPNCVYTVEFLKDSAASNGGLNALGHTAFGSLILGTLTTNGQGNGNAHFDFDPAPGDNVVDTVMYGHIDLEDYSGTCVEADGSSVASNEYGAAPDPLLATPLTWME